MLPPRPLAPSLPPRPNPGAEPSASPPPSPFFTPRRVWQLSFLAPPRLARPRRRPSAALRRWRRRGPACCVLTLLRVRRKIDRTQTSASASPFSMRPCGRKCRRHSFFPLCRVLACVCCLASYVRYLYKYTRLLPPWFPPTPGPTFPALFPPPTLLCRPPPPCPSRPDCISTVRIDGGKERGGAIPITSGADCPPPHHPKATPVAAVAAALQPSLPSL